MEKFNLNEINMALLVCYCLQRNQKNPYSSLKIPKYAIFISFEIESIQFGTCHTGILQGPVKL